jgi:hypothetical protein
MRGRERPAGVRWARPFLDPLGPLPVTAARQTVIDITDNVEDDEHINKILRLTDNVPLAIDLLSHLVNSEGLSLVLRRWETEKTAILSDGTDSKSNFDLSISLSLSSPRMRSSPDALGLLSLLSMLPEGLSDTELLQGPIHLDNILSCKTTLLRTALAYTDEQRRLKSLVPIRECVQRQHPPPNSLIQPLFMHFQRLQGLYSKYWGSLASGQVIHRIRSSLQSIRRLLHHHLSLDNPELAARIYRTGDVQRYIRWTGHGEIQPINHSRLPNDRRLDLYLIVQVLEGWLYRPDINITELLNKALEHCDYLNDIDLKCEFLLSSSFIDTQLDMK